MREHDDLREKARPGRRWRDTSHHGLAWYPVSVGRPLVASTKQFPREREGCGGVGSRHAAEGWGYPRLIAICPWLTREPNGSERLFMPHQAEDLVFPCRSSARPAAQE